MEKNNEALKIKRFYFMCFITCVMMMGGFVLIGAAIFVYVFTDDPQNIALILVSFAGPSLIISPFSLWMKGVSTKKSKTAGSVLPSMTQNAFEINNDVDDDVV